MRILAKLIQIFVLTTFLFANEIYSQSFAGSKAEAELRYLINLPTAGILIGGSGELAIEILPQGLLLAKFEIGATDYFSLGVSYGAANLIGSGKIELNELPGLHAKLKLFRETRSIPSISIGFNSQGKGLFLKDLKRYEIKSPGIYFVVTKNYNFLGYLSFHGQINYTLENKDGDKNLNFGIGFEKTIGPFISLVGEYDLALNDDSNIFVGKDNGYFNIGIRLAASKNLTLGFNFINIFDNLNSTKERESYRSLSINYSSSIF